MEGKEPFLQLGQVCMKLSAQGGPAPAAQLAALGLVVSAGHCSEGVLNITCIGEGREEEPGKGTQEP